ncbi:MAG: hypothetical protein VB115_10445 [Christensenellaceae bacterium]|nr:hypothetical protein [Christensenellaceae bacterium]
MTSTSPKVVTVYCGELCQSSDCNASVLNLLNRPLNGFEANVTVGYEKFVNDPESLPPRILDLLQLAAFIFCADRLINRGDRNSLHNESWARTFEFHLPVLDFEFWSDKNLQIALSECLKYMTGDREYSFIFTKANLSPVESKAKQLSFFSNEASLVEDMSAADVMLLSGGLDSLAGAIERLNEHHDRRILAVNHKSNNSVIKTQQAIVKYLQSHYENRLFPYGFECHNKKVVGSNEETQRTRMFLFSCIAYAICHCFNKHSFYVYENGITSINLPTQGDIMNARASRTTHPKTIGLVKKFLRFFDGEFDVLTPYYSKTKEDVFRVIQKYNEKDILKSSVSCSSTRNQPGMTNHCGCCSQCIDRRFAAFGSGLDEYDAEYTKDFVAAIPDNETKQRLYYTLRLASAEKGQTAIEFYKNYPDEMNDVIEFWHCDNPEDCLAEIHALFSRYGDSVIRGAQLMRTKYDNLRVPNSDNSFMTMLASRDYLKTPTRIRVEEIDRILRKSIPQAFHTERPKNENDFNDTVQALLTSAGSNFTREYPVLRFGITSYRADLEHDGLIIESKYLRDKVSPSVATEGIAADIIKIPDGIAVLFVVYDPERKVTDDEDFASAFESKRQDCFVRIYR